MVPPSSSQRIGRQVSSLVCVADFAGNDDAGGAYTIRKDGFDFAADFHTYEVSWQVDKISLTFDGNEIMSYTKGTNDKFPSDALVSGSPSLP